MLNRIAAVCSDGEVTHSEKIIELIKTLYGIQSDAFWMAWASLRVHEQGHINKLFGCSIQSYKNVLEMGQTVKESLENAEVKMDAGEMSPCSRIPIMRHGQADSTKKHKKSLLASVVQTPSKNHDESGSLELVIKEHAVTEIIPKPVTTEDAESLMEEDAEARLKMMVSDFVESVVTDVIAQAEKDERDLDTFVGRFVDDILQELCDAIHLEQQTSMKWYIAKSESVKSEASVEESDDETRQLQWAYPDVAPSAEPESVLRLEGCEWTRMDLKDVEPSMIPELLKGLSSKACVY